MRPLDAPEAGPVRRRGGSARDCPAGEGVRGPVGVRRVVRQEERGGGAEAPAGGPDTAGRCRRGVAVPRR
jgi:hypothetical protein